MKPYLIIALLAALGTSGLADRALADTVEEPAYSVVRVIGDVELRNYTATIQARTPMAVEGDSSSTFRRLADYIFGGNAGEQSIAMTAPVETSRTKGGYMAFTMPSQYRMEDLPAPLNADVTLHAIPERTLAALPFGGWATEGRVDRNTEALLAALEKEGIEAIGAPALNQYNPPWTPPWRRRNEVVVEVQPR